MPMSFRHQRMTDSERRSDVEHRFWSFVDRQPEGCWNWTASTFKTGYGQFQDGFDTNIPQTAHRVAYRYANGPIGEGEVVRHACDNRKCCRPSHLEIGLHQDNMLDMHKRGRFRNAKLSHADVEYIRANYKKRDKEFGAIALAKRFDVVPSSIVRIVRMFPDSKGSRPWMNRYSEARRG